MDLSGSRIINADRMTVWNALNDPEVLMAAIPGCQEMTGSPEEGFSATVVQKVGPVKAKFKGSVSHSNVVPGESYTLTGEGKGGAAGFAKGGANVRLADAEGGTEMSYDVEAHVGGKLAQLGSRIIDGFAKKMAGQFFDRFAAEVEGPAADAPEEAPVAEAPAAAQPASEAAPAAEPAVAAANASTANEPADEPDKKKGWLRRLIG